MKKIILSSVALIALSTSLMADETSELRELLKVLNERLTVLEAKNAKQVQQTQTLTDELINVQNQTSFNQVDMTQTKAGLGAAASKVYYSKNPLSIGGYGELYYSKDTKLSNDNGGAKTESFRFIPYFGYKFSDSIILNTEVEFEHGGETVSIEQLYIDFLLDSSANIRVGNQLVPMGLINQNHEPVMFNTVLRPDVATYLLPSTWHENGISAYGNLGDFHYNAGMFVALDLNGVTVDKKWLRNGRRGGKGSTKNTSNFAGVARLDYNGINGLLLGGGMYVGRAGKPDVVGAKEGTIVMADIHAQYQKDGFKAKGVYTQTTLSNASSYTVINQMPKKAKGGYINLEYNVLPLFTNSSTRLPLFFQYENYNLASSMSDGSSFGTSNSFTYGLNFFPHEQVVLKAEYSIRENKNDISSLNYTDENLYSFGLGFIF